MHSRLSVQFDCKSEKPTIKWPIIVCFWLKNIEITFPIHFVERRTLRWLHLDLVWGRHFFARIECNRSHVRPKHHRRRLHSGFWLNNGNFRVEPTHNEQNRRNVIQLNMHNDMQSAYLIQRNAELIVEPSLCGFSDSHCICFVSFTFNIVQRMTATSICVTIRKGNLF